MIKITIKTDLYLQCIHSSINLFEWTGAQCKQLLKAY